MGSESHWRQDTADQIVRAWRKEKESWMDPDTLPYHLSRFGFDYVEALSGLSGTAEYICKQFPNTPILDEGSGSTIGAEQIRQTFFPSHDAWGTVLSRPEQRNGVCTLPANRVVFTPAETLNGFHRKYIKRPSQFAFVMGVMSTTYSRAPRQVVASISKVMPEGGVVKFSLFSTRNWSDAYKAGVYDYFTCFELAGFGTSFLFDVPHNNFVVDVLLAVKGKNQDLAKELIGKDFNARGSDKQRALEQTYQE